MTRSTNILCEFLAPTEILRPLKAAGVLSRNECTKIRRETDDSAQIEKLLDILNRKAADKYETFMEVLKEKRPDLYEQVLSFEEKLGYNRVCKSLLTLRGPK